MNDGKNRTTTNASSKEDPFVVDMAYLREQASEAVALFFMPLSCVLRALTSCKRRDRAENDSE